ncbi:hypothetical protein [Mesorhizobium sp.]|uniref:hypothetical protein n=1 Tax=Mesorhizobium sp. TaxID=1871066 RepID=UPI000FE7855F|nr:hypothetical protein [Mesorhizobium sp.]RWQ61949.1 MAG: hypothetical protein EOS86_32490 [Mesorhizobium sp.]
MTDAVADAAFIEEACQSPDLFHQSCARGLYYSRGTTTDGIWIGHGGYGGQYVLANPDTGTALAYMAVVENESGITGIFARP